jgi:hypothetical protein
MRCGAPGSSRSRVVSLVAVKAPAELPDDGVIDGEIVTFDEPRPRRRGLVARNG